VALALQDTLSNLFAGIYIIASKKVMPGDYIKLQSGEEGFIEDISWRTINIIDINDTMIIIPNSQLSTAIFRNFNFPSKEIVITVQLMVGYNNDLHEIEKIAFETAKILIENSPQCVKTHIPAVRFHTFTEFGLQFLVTFRIHQTTDQGVVRHEFIKEVMKKFKENNIEISERVAIRNQLIG
jgi:small-conductance mechanosensitive channel